MKILELYKDNKKTLSFEVNPPESEDDLSAIDETLNILSQLKPDFISVTCCVGGRENYNTTVEVARRIKEKYNIEPVAHLTCINFSKSEIDSFANALQSAGVQNILALRGDIVPNIQPKGDFLHAVDLINYLKTKYDFCFIGACYPEGHPQSKDSATEIKYLKEKVNSGADVLLSQIFFDNNYFYDFKDKCKVADIDVPIISGIMPVTSAKLLDNMVALCGNLTVSPQLKKIIEKFGNNKKALFDAGLSYAVSQVIDLLTSGVDGIHIYTMNNPQVAKRILCEIHNFI